MPLIKLLSLITLILISTKVVANNAHRALNLTTDTEKIETIELETAKIYTFDLDTKPGRIKANRRARIKLKRRGSQIKIKASKKASTGLMKLAITNEDGTAATKTVKLHTTNTRLFCTAEWMPVCGKLKYSKNQVEYKTYSNTCYLEAAGASYQYPGDC